MSSPDVAFNFYASARRAFVVVCLVRTGTSRVSCSWEEEDAGEGFPLGVSCNYDQG